MDTKTKEQLVKRFRSFVWRLGSYVIVASLAFIADNIGLFTASPVIVTIVALVCGEITKYLNTYQK